MFERIRSAFGALKRRKKSYTTNAMAQYLAQGREVKPGSVAYMLRTCLVGLQSYGGFQWTSHGPQDCPDWNPDSVCGGGLHGLLWGRGSRVYFNEEQAGSELLWMVCGVWLDDVVHIGDGSIKVPRAWVCLVGTRSEAVELITNLGAVGCHYSTFTGGRGSVFAGGDFSQLTGGSHSVFNGGYASTLVGGLHSVLTGGDCSTITGGDCSSLSGGFRSILKGGYSSQLLAGGRSSLVGGQRSELKGGDYSTLVGGKDSLLIGGVGSTFSGGERACFVAFSWVEDRFRTIIGYVGEGGLEEDTPYTLDASGAWVVSFNQEG